MYACILFTVILARIRLSVTALYLSATFEDMSIVSVSLNKKYISIGVEGFYVHFFLSFHVLENFLNDLTAWKI